MKGWLLALAILVVPGIARAAEPPAVSGDALKSRAIAVRLWEQRRWQLLLHEEPDGRGGTRSSVGGKDFFLAPDGRASARDELLATIDALARPGDPAACRFVARRKFLEQSLAVTFPAATCPDYDEWREKMGDGSVTLVFASSYVGSPASTFGHTFLRFDPAGGDSPLLAIAVEYAANPTTYNPLFYTAMGLTGGFEGRFFSRPYFSKVQQYSNLEARDLWEYRLALDDDRRDWLLRHLWELDAGWFAYYFASKNCSWQLLAVLDVALPEAHLADRFPETTVPADSVRAVVAAGLVASRTLRPSQQSVLLARRALLTRAEARIADRIANLRDPADPPALDALAPERRALVLDAASDLFRHRYGYWSARQQSPPPAVARRADALASERGLVDVRTSPPAVPSKAPPEDGHASSRAGVGAFGTRGVEGAEISWRLALHDLLDEQGGYPTDTELEMLSARLRVVPRRLDETRSADAVVIDRLDVVRIVSMTPRDRWIHPIAWRAWLGGGRVPGRDERWRSTAVDANVGFGQALGASWPFETVWYGFVDANPAAGPAFGDGWRAGGDVAVGTLWGLTRGVRAQGEAALRWDPLGGPRPDTRFTPFFRAPSWTTLSRTRPDARVDASLNLSVGRNQELRAAAEWTRGAPELSASLSFLY